MASTQVVREDLSEEVLVKLTESTGEERGLHYEVTQGLWHSQVAFCDPRELREMARLKAVREGGGEAKEPHRSVPRHECTKEMVSF